MRSSKSPVDCLHFQFKYLKRSLVSPTRTVWALLNLVHTPEDASEYTKDQHINDHRFLPEVVMSGHILVSESNLFDGLSTCSLDHG